MGGEGGGGDRHRQTDRQTEGSYMPCLFVCLYVCLLAWFSLILVSFLQTENTKISFSFSFYLFFPGKTQLVSA